jgi:hypothetical protein
LPNYLFIEFNPIILAGWFIINGKKTGKKLVLSREILKLEERTNIVNIINVKYNLDASTSHKKIFISNRTETIKLILPYMHSSQYYRLFINKK